MVKNVTGRHMDKQTSFSFFSWMFVAAGSCSAGMGRILCELHFYSNEHRYYQLRFYL